MIGANDQLALPIPERKCRGGQRPGAGRKPRGSGPGVPHRSRGSLSPHHPIHVTLRMREHVYNLRSRRCFRVIEQGIAAAKAMGDVRVVHFSVQGNHIHLVVEAGGLAPLARGMKGLAVRIARGLNRVMSRRGSVFTDRYHTHVLRTPTEVRNAIRYVLGNFASHAARRGETVAGSWVDPFSSSCSTAGAPPHTWLLTVGWSRTRCRLGDSRRASLRVGATPGVAS